ncbi:MAG: hypothetical protein Q9164_002929 [Protoblastenia rupestris]
MVAPGFTVDFAFYDASRFGHFFLLDIYIGIIFDFGAIMVLPAQTQNMFCLGKIICLQLLGFREFRRAEMEKCFHPLQGFFSVSKAFDWLLLSILLCMADPLSIVGSVIGIASLGIQVTQSLIDFYKTYKNQKYDLASTLRNLEDLKNTLGELEKIWVGRNLTEDHQRLVERIQESIRNCNDAVNELNTACQKFTRITQPGLKKSFDTIKYQIEYPFKKSTLEKLNIDITEIRDNLAFLLQIVQLGTITRYQDDLGELKAVLESIDGRQISSTLRDWLNVPDATVDHIAACEKKKRNPGSGTWFVESPQFTSWLVQEKSFLWLKGFAGSGKSVLCSTAIQSAFQHRRGDRNIAVAFFYFSFSDESKQDESCMIRALLWQLSNQSSDRHIDLLQLYEAHKTGTPSSTVLRAYLRRLFGRFRQVYIFLDALDECLRSEGRERILETLEEIQKWDLLHIHLFITSRDEADIRIDNDIANFVSRQLNEDRQLLKLSPYRDQIRIALTEGAKGVYLNSCHNSLNATYERMFYNIDDDLIEDIRRILTLLCFAYRPLTTQELIDGIAVDIRGQAGLNYSRKLQDVDDIRDICSGFVEIDNIGDPALKPDSNDQIRSTVRIAHFSIQEYLVSTHILRSKAKIFSIDKLSAHAEIAQICLIYLLEDGLRGLHFDEHLVKQFPLSHFAALYWHRHYMDAAESAFKLDTLILSLFQNRQSFAVWVKLHDVDRDSDDEIDFDQQIDKVLSPIYYASLLGLEETLSILVNEHPVIAVSEQIKAQGEGYHYGDALQAASSGGHQNIVQLLLEKGADVNAHSGLHGNALQVASARGYQDLVQFLLDNGAEVNTRCGYSGSALQAASSAGHQNIVQLLLNKGAKINTQSGEYSGALQAASSRGHRNIVKLLLDNGAEVNTRCGYSGSALQAASSAGYQDLVQFLLDNGAEINTQSGYYGSALQAASHTGYQNLVQLLLDNGADVNAQGGRYGNALQAASFSGYQDLVQFLLDKGADVNAQNGYFGNALQAASSEGYQDLVQLLLDKEANVNAQGGEYSNALQAASSRGYQNIVQLLLENGADTYAGGKK